MVCVPCFIAPVLLFIWYKFIYPILRPILVKYFGNRFAEPTDPDYCPICPLNDKSKCVNKDDTSNEKKKENETQEIEENKKEK